MKCDAKTFAQMYETVYKELYRFALCMMKDSHDAEDVVSEAVISAYEHIGSLKKEESFKSWIFTILANICKKKRKKQQEIVCLYEEDIVAMPTDAELNMDIRNAFFILTMEEQMIIGLSVFGGYQSQEIGKIMRLNANTVRSKRSRALEKMGCLLDVKK